MTELHYYAYGGTRYNPGNQVTTDPSLHSGHTGQRWDSGTSLYYYGARWYDPAIGRFLAADTIVPQPGNPQSLNRYSYVLNNALKYTDPTGHSNCLESVGGGAGSGGFISGYGRGLQSDGLRQALTVAMDWLQRLIGPAVMMAQNADKLPAARDVGNAGSGNTGNPGGLDPNKWGKWVERLEAMSDRARIYQEHVTGRADGRVFQVDGVTFDGIRNGTLLDAKGYYRQFVDPSTGSFKTWWQGANDLVQQAQRQLEVAKGTQIEWHFNEVEALEAVRRLFAETGIGQGITLILDQMP